VTGGYKRNPFFARLNIISIIYAKPKAYPVLFIQLLGAEFKGGV
jgi:hypothetical protein